MRAQDIVLESGAYFVVRATFGKNKTPGFEVYKNGLLASTRCAQIGHPGEIGLRYARNEIERRQEKDRA